MPTNTQTRQTLTIGRIALIMGLLLALHASGQQQPPDQAITTWRGMWIATAGESRMFRGRWWASLTAGSHAAASGSWTLLSDSNQILLEGTWSARKSAQGWHGTWSAKANGGGPFSGTWTSNVPDINAKTFEDLLTATIHQQVAGSWQTGRMHGNWSLQGP